MLVYSGVSNIKTFITQRCGNGCVGQSAWQSVWYLKYLGKFFAFFL
jgi:hypothetical protein